MIDSEIKRAKEHKMVAFQSGWDKWAYGLMMPVAVRRDGDFITFEAMVESLDLQECSALGEKEGKTYFDAVVGQND